MGFVLRLLVTHLGPSLFLVGLGNRVCTSYFEGEEFSKKGGKGTDQLDHGLIFALLVKMTGHVL